MHRAARLSLLAPAKINLSLHVRGRRPDGYHALESLVAFADIGDRLHFEKAETTSLTLSGRFGSGLDGANNSVLQAHAKLTAFTGEDLPCMIGLEKNLPVASGIGGGSADAAATLRGLCALFGLTLDASDMAALAAQLGADVPVCLGQGPAWMCGIGHDVTRLSSLPAADIVLVNPCQSVSTAAVFKALGAGEDLSAPQAIPTGFDSLDALVGFLAAQGNALTAPARSLVPAIADCLIGLEKSGCAFAAMSGSGATCFGLTAPGQGGDMAETYRRLRGDDWVQAGVLLGSK